MLKGNTFNLILPLTGSLFGLEVLLEVLENVLGSHLLLRMFIYNHLL